MDTDPLPSSPLASILSILLQNVAPAVTFHAPPSWGIWTLIIILSILCLLTSAFMSGTETAYFGMTPDDIEELEESENPTDKKAFNLIRNSDRLLATILIGNNLVNITMVVLLTFAISQTVEIANPILNFLLQTVLLTFLLLLFGEIFPKLVARGRTMSWVRMSQPLISFFYNLLRPISSLMVSSSVFLNRMVVKKRDNISTDELERALEISDMTDIKEKEMLEGILSFGEKCAHEIMISRVDVTAIEYHDSWNEVQKIILESGYSRIPVFENSQDSIIGILYSKDLLKHIGTQDEDFRWQNLLREPYFVPESRMIDDLLEDFRKRKIHIAIVVDEYGGTQGIVTLEDIIEEIVGEIDDEYDSVTSMYKKLASDVFIFDAKIPIDDFFRAMDMDSEEFVKADNVETLAGLLLEIKGDFPTVKETIQEGDLKFQVIQMEKHRIVKVKVTKTNGN